MTPREQLLRLVDWAFWLSIIAMALVFFGLFMLQPLIATAISSEAVWKAGQGARPSSGSPDQARRDRYEREELAGDAAYEVASGLLKTGALFVGLPIALLLLVVCVLLSRLRTRLLRGEEDGGSSRFTRGTAPR